MPRVDDKSLQVDCGVGFLCEAATPVRESCNLLEISNLGLGFGLRVHH